MLPCDLEYPIAPPEALFCECLPSLGNFCVGDCSWHKGYRVSILEKHESEVTIFCKCLMRESSCLFESILSPGSYGSGNDSDSIHRSVGSSIEILTGDIFDGLEFREE